MLRCVAQNVSRLAVRPPALMRGMALEGTAFSEGEKAIEDLYFTKEDQRLMSKLLVKVRSSMAYQLPSRSTPAKANARPCSVDTGRGVGSIMSDCRPVSVMIGVTSIP
jgi:hypothetical protein